MMGIFDSGFGGLPILRALRQKLPAYDYCYFGDNAHTPYGSRSQEEIFALTLQGVEFLFQQGCPLVILGCNTASAAALRRIQQEVLPAHYPDRRVLGVLVPTIEQFTERSVQHVGVVATHATVQSHAYRTEIQKRHPFMRVSEGACPELATMVEDGASAEVIEPYIKDCLESFSELPEVLVLGCTHYELVENLFRKNWPTVLILTQSSLVASSLSDYLKRRPEIEQRLSQNGSIRFLTTGDPVGVSQKGSVFFGSPIAFTNP